MCFKESGGKQSFSILHERWARLPDEPQCLQTKQQEHSQLCQQLGRALLAAFLKFSFLLPLSKSFQKLSWSRHPCSHLPMPCMLHISERFPPAPSAEEKGRCSRGPTIMAKEREAQGTFPSRITFVINQNIAIFSWTVISIQICTLYFPLYFPDSHWLSPFVPPLNLNNDWNYHWHCCSTLAPALSLGSVTEEEWVEISVEALMVAPILFFSVISSSSLQLSWNHSLTAECLCQGCSFKDSSLGRLSSAPQCFPLTWNSYFCSAGNGDIINKST